MIQGGGRDRSRSPIFERKRGIVDNKAVNAEIVNNMANINPMIMNNMYQQGNMIMPGMYPNMIIPGTIMGGGMLQSANMDMMTTNGMEMIPQQSIELATIGAQTMAPASGTPMNINMIGGMMMDPSMMGMSMYGNMGTDATIPAVEKKEIVLKHCILTPADPETADPPRRTKPLGCRTIFVGGLPDKIRDGVVRDIFEKYGRIQTLRLSKKNFCHIRFDRESCVDAAMQLSGYRIHLLDKENKDEEDDSHAYSGWLHVDYALSRDDQNEYERRQRQVLRAQQAQLEQTSSQHDFTASVNSGGSRHSQSRIRSPSPPRIQPFSSASVKQLVEKIKSEDHFASTLPTLLSWLERGECSKKNFLLFYSMLQATNAHIRRLFNEKMQAEEELQQCKENVMQRIERVIEQLEQVWKVFNAATHQRNWDHFTKPQRKNIETWQKMTQEFTNIKDEFNEKFQNEDCEYNNISSNMSVNNNMSFSTVEDSSQLKRENESLQFQLEAYKNEVDVIKAEAKREMEKFKAQFIARQALQGNIDIMNNPPLPSPIQKPPPPPPLPDDLNSKVHIKNVVEAGCGEAKLIGVMSAFLQVHPQGASLDYVVSYVQALFSHVSQATVHHVLQKHSDVFQQNTTGVGANIENRWTFVAFQKDKMETLN